MRKYSSYSGRSRSNYTPRSIRTKERKTKKLLIRNIILGIIIIYGVFFWGLPALVGGLSFLHRSPSSSKATTSPVEDISVAPPVLNIPYEATNTATIKISGYTTPNSKVELYVNGDLKTKANAGSDGNFQTDDIALVLGTNNIYGKTIDSANKTSLPSKSIQLTYSNEQPKLDLSSPGDNTQVKGGDKKVNVSGNTDPSNTVSINGTITVVDSQGHFSYDAPLNDGDNTITVSVTNSVGNTTQIQRKVNYSS